MVKRGLFRGLAVGVALFVLIASAALSAEAKSRPLFEEVQGQVTTNRGRQRAEVRVRRVKVDISAVAGIDQPEGEDAIELNLFTDKKFEAKKSRFQRRDKSHFTWFGKVPDDPESAVVLVVGEGRIQGTVFAHGKYYSIRGADAASQEVVEVDQSALPKEACDESPAGDATQTAPALPSYPDTMADSGTVIDVLVVYTAAARIAAGGANSINDRAQLAVDWTNVSYTNSFITPRLNLVHAQEISYTESGDLNLDLGRLSGKTDGYMDSVHALRNTYNADVVVLMINNGEYCGMAYLNAAASSAFALVHWGYCAVENLSLAHEIGHLQGARHDRRVDPGYSLDPYYNYNHGDVYIADPLADSRRTVMAYPCLDPIICTRLAYWSNPDVLYPGTTRSTGGVAGENDNARVLDQSAYKVANFAVNDRPTLNAIPNRTINEDAALQTVYLSGISAGGGETQALAVTAVTTTNPGLIPNPTVSYVPSRTTGSLSFKPVANASGTAVITVTVTADGSSAPEDIFERSFVVTVNGVNDPPTLQTLANVVIAKNAGEQPVALEGISAGVGEDSLPQPLTVTAVSSKTSLIQIAGVDYTSPDPTGILRFLPITNAYGTATITVTVRDGQPTNNTVTRSFVVTVNDPPTLNAISNLEIYEDAGRQTVALNGISAGAGEIQTLKVTAVTTVNPGLIPNPTVSYYSPRTTGSLSFASVANGSGTATITVTVNDSQLGNNLFTRSFDVTVNPVNDGPTLNPIVGRTIREDAAAQTVLLSGISAGGGETQEVTLTATSSNLEVISDLSVSPVHPGATAVLSFTPVANASGGATITVRVTDGALTLARSFIVRVLSVNDAPTFFSGADQTVLEDVGAQSVPGWASIGAVPADESTQSRAFWTTNNNTRLFAVQPAVSANGALSFKPALNKSGSATVTVLLRDNGGTANGGKNASASQTFTITVTAVNDPPTLNAISPRTISEEAAQQTVYLYGISAGGGERQALAVTAVSSDPLLIPNPTWSYTSPATWGILRFKPLANAFGTATLTVTVTADGGGENNIFERSFVVTVKGVNDPPTLDAIQNQTISTDAVQQPVYLSGISAGVGESQGLTLTATSSYPGLVPNPMVEYTSPDPTGILKFTPVSTTTGVVRITVAVKDGQAVNGTAVRSFYLTVTPPVPLSDAPLSNGDAPSLSASFVGSINSLVSDNPSGPAPLGVTFDAAGSAGPDPIVSYHWDFGDRQVSDTATATVAHRYTATGSYFVTLTVTDSSGGTNSTQRLVTVADAVQTAATAAELQAALEIAGTNGKHDIIRLAGGSYPISAIDGERFAYASAENEDLVIEGGWTPDFSQRAFNIPTELRNDVPGTTAGPGGVLEITAGGSVGLGGLIIGGGQAAGSGGGVHISAVGSIVVGNCQILNNSSGGDGGGLFLESTGGDVRLHGSTIRGNSGAGGGGGGLVKALSVSVQSNEISGNAAAALDGGLQVSVISGGTMIVSNNTIYGNQAPAGGSGLSVAATGTRGMSVLDIHNNIVYGNGVAPNFVVAPDTDCLLNYLDLNIVNNDIACYEMCPEYLLDGSNTSADFSGRGAGTFRLAATDAALIDQGSPDTVPFEDIEGDAIPLAGRGDTNALPDIGADEFNPENIAGASSMTVSVSGSITAANGGATITVALDAPAKRDLVVFLSSSDPAIATLSSSYLKILKGSSSARTVVQAASGARSGVSTITVTDPSGRIAQGSVTVAIVE